MKNLFLAVLFFVIFTAQAFADEEFTLWTSQTFTPSNGVSFVDQEVIAISAEVSNANDYSSLNVVVRYETLIPDQATGAATYGVQALIESYIAGQWIPVLNQSQEIKNTKFFPLRLLTMVPDFNMVRQPGNNYGVQTGPKRLLRITIAAGHLTSKFRVKLVHTDEFGGFPLTSITVSGFGRKFNREFVPAGTP